MANIIIKDRTKIGRTRSEQEINLRKEWGQTMTDEQLDKMKYIEKKVKEHSGSSDSFVQVIATDNVK